MIEKTASVHWEGPGKKGQGFVIDRIALTQNAVVPGIDDAKFQEIALTAKRECPLSKALSAVAEISLKATQGARP